MFPSSVMIERRHMTHRWRSETMQVCQLKAGASYAHIPRHKTIISAIIYAGILALKSI